MVLNQAELQRLLARALGRVRVPDGCAAVLEGSIAEGFGNPSSDVDFLLLDDSDEVYAGTPTVLFDDGWRIEVRVRSVREAAEDRDALWRLGRAGSAARIPDDLLNRCQRLARAVPVLRSRLVAALQRTMPLTELGTIASRAYAHRSRECGRLAVALTGLGDHAAAATWAETALVHGAKAWMALRGETYVDAKWLDEQLRRVGGRGGADAVLVERCQAMLPRAVARLPEPSYVARALSLLAQLGVGGCPLEPGRARFRRQPGVTTWPIDGQVHVVRDGRDVFALDDAAARAWRSVVFEQPLPIVVEGAGAEDAGRLMAEFHRFGFVRLAWRGGGTIAAAPTVTPPPGVRRPPLSLGGAQLEQEGTGIALVPVPARRFAAAGMALVWCNVMVENAREDAVGAVAQGQWGVAAAAVRRALQRVCMSVLSAYGVDPLPAQEEACAQLAGLPEIDRALAADVLALEQGAAVVDERSAQRALAAADQLVSCLRERIGAEGFPCSFLDAARWRSTLETFYDWVRIGAHLDSALPLDELRDVVTSLEQRRGTVPVLS